VSAGEEELLGYTLIGVAYTLTQFATTGRLGALQIGMLESEVRRLLGDPDDVSLTGPQIWKYGQLEVTFTSDPVEDAATLAHERAVDLMVVKVSQTDYELPHQLGVTADLTSTSTFAEVAVALSERQAVLETIVDLRRPMAAHVRQSGVTFTFGRDRLESISLSRDETEPRT
jgi:hypothetical protein